MENKLIELNDGKYVVEVQAIKKDSTETSAMAPYLANNAIITKEAGQNFVTLVINEEEVVKGLQVKSSDNTFKNSINNQVNQDENVRYEIFHLEQIQTILPARVQYKINYEGNIIEGDEELRLFINDDTIQNVEDMEF